MNNVRPIIRLRPIVHLRATAVITCACCRMRHAVVLDSMGAYACHGIRVLPLDRVA